MENQVKKLTICSVGDLMICDSPLYASVGIGSRYSRIREELFSNCKALFSNADIVIGNFETVVHTPQNRSLKETQMCCNDDVVEGLKKAGFSILNIANNHCMQHGVHGFQNTSEACEKRGIKPIGIRDEHPYFITINGVSLVFLSLCIHLEWYEPDQILYENRILKILNEIKILREQDQKLRIIVSIHWGDEFASYPSNAQIALAHKMVELGANVILGHHSHVYQGIEEYEGSLIVYGQGNFISDMVPELCCQTGIVCIEMNNEMILNYKMVPYTIGCDYIPMVSKNNKWFKDRQNLLYCALNGEYTDDDYWKTISHNHQYAHNAFKTYFKQNISNYSLRIVSRMILDFVRRKIKRIIGVSSDGKVSSMDSEIYQVLKELP